MSLGEGFSGRIAAVALALLLATTPVRAGLVITGGNGISATAADGIVYQGTSGFMASQSNGLLAFAPNGITAPFSNGIVMTGADAGAYPGANGISATGADGVSVTAADTATFTGTNGISITTTNGSTYQADSVVLRGANGINMTGADTLAMSGVLGITQTAPDGITATAADGIVATGADGVSATAADGITMTGADGTVTQLESDGITMTGADGIAVTSADGISVTGADTLEIIDYSAVPATPGVGLQSVDPELAAQLDAMTDDSGVNAVIAYHAYPTSGDVDDLRVRGILGGTIFRVLPFVVVAATKAQILSVSQLPAVRSIYGVRTLQLTTDRSREVTGATRVAPDGDLTTHNGGAPLSGQGVTVAVIDSGVNGTHPDLEGRVVRNVKVAEFLGLPLGFQYPTNVEGLPNTDLVNGHGTFVAGVVAGSGASSGGRYRGVAPGAGIIGLSAGDLNFFHVLAAFDFVLDQGPAHNTRVVNCSFSANTVFDLNDPVNIATRMLDAAGVTVVFSAGNTGPGWSSLNPYAMAPWVVGVGATDDALRLAAYSSRGAFASHQFRPKLVAPGTSVVSLRSSPAISVTGALGIQSGQDLEYLSPLELPFYTTASGTSFSAPQVAGAVALMLDANPALTTADVRDILQRTASPMPGYFQHEVGAGMLNVHAAALEAAFSARRFGAFRAALDRGQVAFVQDAAVTGTGAVAPGAPTPSNVSVPPSAVRASYEVAWGPLSSTNDLGVSLADPAGAVRAQSNVLNLAGLTGRRERATVLSPAPGTWRASVFHTFGLGTPQEFTSAFETARAEYAPILDLGSVDPETQADIRLAVRSLVMQPIGNRFRPSFGVRRIELAEAAVVSGRTPQYLPSQPSHSDVSDVASMTFVESAQAAPDGPLFPDAAPGASFQPDAFATRLAAAIALVRATGGRAEADSRAGEPLPFSDAALVPAEWRGYVAVAVERGLLRPRGAAFEPTAPFTRAELAHAHVVMLGLGAPAARETVGVYVPASGVWHERFSNTAGFADNSFVYGPAEAAWVPIAGDWNGDGAASPGLYDPATGVFYLTDASSAGPADRQFQYGPPGVGWLPIAGDWDGDGDETIGLYDPATGVFYLRNTHASGPADLQFQYGPGGLGWRPIAGDWDGNATDTVGLYDPSSGVFYLRDSNSAGVATRQFAYGPAGQGWSPVAGDWNGDGEVTVGLHEPAHGVFHLRDAHAAGPADVTVLFGPPGSTPVTGNWTGQ